MLRSYGPLTRETLLEFAGGRAWPDCAAFDAVLDDAVAAGRVRSLGGVLFEAADRAPAAPLAPSREVATGS